MCATFILVCACANVFQRVMWWLKNHLNFKKWWRHVGIKRLIRKSVPLTKCFAVKHEQSSYLVVLSVFLKRCGVKCERNPPELICKCFNWSGTDKALTNLIEVIILATIKRAGNRFKLCTILILKKYPCCPPFFKQYGEEFPNSHHS